LHLPHGAFFDRLFELGFDLFDLPVQVSDMFVQAQLHRLLGSIEMGVLRLTHLNELSAAFHQGLKPILGSVGIGVGTSDVQWAVAERLSSLNPDPPSK
ncbi:MAG: hypothetical protein BRD33_03675, partial [Bacteroidetes bacterium QH_6_63_17]